MPITIIGDIHGEATLLHRLLSRISPDDNLIFVGDLIDRGHDNRSVVETVRRLVDNERARCLMGNHELNAILFHTIGPDGTPLRERSDQTKAQHAAFLKDYAIDASETADVIDWFKTFPLFIEHDGLRIVHAEWDKTAIRFIRQIGDGAGRLPPDWLECWPNDAALRSAMETLTKGTRFALPAGRTYQDKIGFTRHTVRLSWWNARDASTLEQQIAGPASRKFLGRGLPPRHTDKHYPADAPPVIFGHYGLDDDQPYRAPNVICTDFTRRAGGPLTAWRSDGSWMQVS